MALSVPDLFAHTFQLPKSPNGLSVFKENWKSASCRGCDAEWLIDVEPLRQAPAPDPLGKNDDTDLVHLDGPATGGNDDRKTLVWRGLLTPTSLSDDSWPPRQAGDVHR